MSGLAWLLLLSFIALVLWFIASTLKYLGVPESEHIQREHEARTKYYEAKREVPK